MLCASGSRRRHARTDRSASASFGAALVALRLALLPPAATLGVIPADRGDHDGCGHRGDQCRRHGCHLCRFQQLDPVLKHSQPAILFLDGGERARSRRTSAILRVRGPLAVRCGRSIYSTFILSARLVGATTSSQSSTIRAAGCPECQVVDALANCRTSRNGIAGGNGLGDCRVL